MQDKHKKGERFIMKQSIKNLSALEKKNAIEFMKEVRRSKKASQGENAGKLTVTDVIKRDNVTFGRNNMILAPVSSGKTYFIQNVIAPNIKGKKLMLVSTTSLKDSICKEGMVFTTQDMRRKELNVNDENIYIMTYAEFGYKVKWDIESNFIKSYELILCDEIHSLFDYYLSHKSSREYLAAIWALFKTYEDTQIFYFTGTTEMMDIFVDREWPEVFKNVLTFNYLNDVEIKKLGQTLHETYFDSADLESMLEMASEMRKINEKGLVFNSKISGMKKIEEILIKLGFSVESIWSKHNKEKMTEEQLKLRETLLETGIIPDEYDFVIINEAMREGWNLNDERVQIVIIDDVSETNIVQARGRVRHNISLLITKSKEEVNRFENRVMQRERQTGTFESIIGEELTYDELREVCLKFNLLENRKVALFQALKPVLEKNGFKFDTKRKVVNGKKLNIYKVSKIEKSTKPSEVRKSTMLLSRLSKRGLFDNNESFFNRYMGGKGKLVALNQIVRSYNDLVVDGEMSEKMFELTTYKIINDKNIFTKKFYLEKSYEISLLSEEGRMNLEFKATGDNKVKEQIDTKKSKEEQELIDYIIANGGL